MAEKLEQLYPLADDLASSLTEETVSTLVHASASLWAARGYAITGDCYVEVCPTVLIGIEAEKIATPRPTAEETEVALAAGGDAIIDIGNRLKEIGERREVIIAKLEAAARGCLNRKEGEKPK